MFKVGDIVEITAEAHATGMLDFVDGKGYDVIGVTGANHEHILLEDEGSRGRWHAASHFKLKEES